MNNLLYILICYIIYLRYKLYIYHNQVNATNNFYMSHTNILRNNEVDSLSYNYDTTIKKLNQIQHDLDDIRYNIK